MKVQTVYFIECRPAQKSWKNSEDSEWRLFVQPSNTGPDTTWYFRDKNTADRNVAVAAKIAEGAFAEWRVSSVEAWVQGPPTPPKEIEHEQD